MSDDNGQPSRPADELVKDAMEGHLDDENRHLDVPQAWFAPDGCVMLADGTVIGRIDVPGYDAAQRWIQTIYITGDLHRWVKSLEMESVPSSELLAKLDEIRQANR